VVKLLRWSYCAFRYLSLFSWARAGPILTSLWIGCSCNVMCKNCGVATNSLDLDFATGS